MNQRQTILIVEDEKINRKIITKVLGELVQIFSVPVFHGMGMKKD